MAPHILSVMQGIVSGTEATKYFEFALGHTRFGDNLDMEDWQALVAVAHTENHDQIVGAVKMLLPKYERMWRWIGEPRNADEWTDLRYKLMKEELAR